MATNFYKNEVWKIHPKHPNYEFSNYGRVCGIKSKAIRRTEYTTRDYVSISLFENGKSTKYNVHRLIAELFVENPNPNICTQVNHKDEDKTNNCASNLEWVTPKQNANYGTRNKRVAINLSNGKIIKYDTNGNVIKIFDSLKRTQIEDGSHIRIIILKGGGFYKGYYYFKENVQFHK